MQVDDQPGALAQRPSSVSSVGVSRPRPFPIIGEAAPGPRCGHTLTTITGPDGDVNKAKLVLFGTKRQGWHAAAGAGTGSLLILALHNSRSASRRWSNSARGLHSKEPRWNTLWVTGASSIR
jgi:hypothetical protein